jgi:hypothetical protein
MCGPTPRIGWFICTFGLTREKRNRKHWGCDCRPLLWSKLLEPPVLVGYALSKRNVESFGGRDQWNAMCCTHRRLKGKTWISILVENKWKSRVSLVIFVWHKLWRLQQWKGYGNRMDLKCYENPWYRQHQRRKISSSFRGLGEFPAAVSNTVTSPSKFFLAFLCLIYQTEHIYRL